MTGSISSPTVKQSGAPTALTATFSDDDPCVPELFMDHRAGRYLLMNVAAGRWCAGDALTALILQLCDGTRDVTDIYGLVSSVFADLSLERVSEIIEALRAGGMFSTGVRQEIAPSSNVFLNITKVCNLNCPFCFANSGPDVREKRDQCLSVAQWFGLMDDIRTINPDCRIYISGGEPFAHAHALDLIERACASARAVTVINNGTLLDSNKIQKLAAFDNLTVQISIDSLDPQENAQSRGEQHLDKALKALDGLLEAKVRTCVSATLTQINKDNLWRLQAHCKKKGVKFRISSFFLSNGRALDNQDDLAITPDALWDLVKRHSQKFGAEEVVRSNTVAVPPGFLRRSCGVGYGTVAIEPNGDVSPCNHLANEGLAVGNVLETPLQDCLAEGERRYAHIDVERLEGSPCQTCPVRYMCGGGCRAQSHHEYGDFTPAPPECALHYKAHVNSLWIDVLGAEVASVLANA